MVFRPDSLAELLNSRVPSGDRCVLSAIPHALTHGSQGLRPFRAVLLSPYLCFSANAGPGESQPTLTDRVQRELGVLCSVASRFESGGGVWLSHPSFQMVIPRVILRLSLSLGLCPPC